MRCEDSSGLQFCYVATDASFKCNIEVTSSLIEYKYGWLSVQRTRLARDEAELVAREFRIRHNWT